MSFPRVKRGARGYNAEQVDAFIAQARVAYDSNIAGAVTLTSTDIRNTAFALATMGEAAWLQQTSELSAALTSRFARKPGQRFNKAKFLAQGYKVKDVDAFAERVNAFLTTGEPLSVADVRSVTFRPGRGGYDEAQVDAVLDALVELLLALGNN
ncbi:MAG: hypothetical protein RLY59_134 [Actinomycetota bacterium]